MAVDAQGADVVRPWVEAAHATFQTVVDSDNVLARLYRVKVVPIGILVDEAGRLVKGPFVINVDEERVRAELEAWLAGEAAPAQESASVGEEDSLDRAEVDTRFQLGLILLRKGQRQEAMAEWRRAAALDPDNWIIHKQIWAVEHPERFYDGPVDYGWQKEQLAAGR